MATAIAAQPIVVEMSREKDTKTKIRYTADSTDPTLAFDNIYVDKAKAAELGDKIRVTVEPA